MEDIGHGLHDMTSLAAARIGETVNDMPKAETWFIQKMTGLPHVQFALSATTLKATDYNMRRVIDEYATATSPEKMRSAQRRLLQMGVDPQRAKSWRQSGYKKDHDFYRDSWIPRLYRSLRTTIVEPHAVDKPVWMGAEHWLLISQLKSFMFTFQNLVLNDSAKQLMQEGPGRNREIVLRAAPYMAAYVLGQAGILTLKEWMREGEVDEDTMDDKIIMAIGQQGLLSIVSDLYHGIAGRSGVLESVSPAAGFINRQIKGNVRLVDDIMSGEISAEDAVREVISINTPRTLIDPAVRAVTDEVLGERE